MRVVLHSIQPNEKSLNPELLVTVRIEMLQGDLIPFAIHGELYSEDDMKLASLAGCDQANHRTLSLSATGTENHNKKNHDFSFTLSALLTEKAIVHLENYRLTHKQETKEVILKADIQVDCLHGNIEISHLNLQGFSASTPKENPVPVVYKTESYYKPKVSDMWILSGSGSPTYLQVETFRVNNLQEHIDLMDWVNNYSPYLGLGTSFVYEFLQPDGSIFNKELSDAYSKAQSALSEMQKLLKYGEWKQAVIAARPVVELFSHFDNFKPLLIGSGYSESAYKELKDSAFHYFHFISKFYHSASANAKELNPDILVYKEDAYMAYSYCVSLLYLVTQKAKKY